MNIEGKFVKYIYKSAETLYKVILIETRLKNVIACGDIPELEEGLNYTFTGEYKVHDKYGEQFNVMSIKKASDTPLGLISYFAGDKFKGIGTKLATAIVSKLGVNAIAKINSDPTLLEGISGLTKAKREMLITELKKQTFLDESYIILADYGLSKKMIKKLLDNYGNETIARIKENPYRLIYEIEGYGFVKSDKLALSIGFSKDNKVRIREALLYTLSDSCYKDGNTFVNKDELILNTLNLLDFTFSDEIKLLEALKELENKNRLVLLDMKVYPLNLYNAEVNVASRLKELENHNNQKYSKDILNKAVKYAADNLGIRYTELQEEALCNIFNDQVSIITGGPGTGKTTLVKGILRIFSYLINKDITSDEYRVLQVAPTGRAAKRMTESTGYGAFTIHKALGYIFDKGFEYNENNQLYYQLIIVDESSMIDIELANNLLKAVKNGTKIIFIGDENQLPSVSPGNFLHDIIVSNIFKVYRLKEVMRQAKDSNIIKLANMILNEKIDYQIFNEKKEVFSYHIETNRFYTYLKRLLDRYLKLNENLDDLQILIPMYAGNVGIDKCNEFIQEKYNQNKEKSITYGKKKFYVGDKVLQLQNNSELGIMNGDIGKIIGIADDITIDFNSHIVTLEKSDLENLSLAYAISIHKSQGSEVLNVVVPIYKSYSIMLKKRLVYTAITRAKSKLIMIGDISILSSSILYKETLRNSSLASFLMNSKKISKYKEILDPLSAFSELKEELKNLTPYDFL